MTTHDTGTAGRVRHGRGARVQLAVTYGQRVWQCELDGLTAALALAGYTLLAHAILAAVRPSERE